MRIIRISPPGDAGQERRADIDAQAVGDHFREVMVMRDASPNSRKLGQRLSCGERREAGPKKPSVADVERSRPDVRAPARSALPLVWLDTLRSAGVAVGCYCCG